MGKSEVFSKDDDFEYDVFKPGWLLPYIEKELPIHESWKDRFIDELVSPNQEYRSELEQSLRVHGVRWI